MGYVVVREICTLTRLPSASMQLQDFTVLLLSLHCDTWDMYPVAVPLNAHASIVQVHMYMYEQYKTHHISSLFHWHLLLFARREIAYCKGSRVVCMCIGRLVNIFA